MGLLKKNLSLTIIVGVCVLVFCAGGYLTFAESGKITKAKRAIEDAEMQLDNLRFANPAPTQANVDASRANVAELEQEIQKARDVLQRGARLATSDDGIGVMASIQQYISEFERKAQEYTHTDADGVEQPIALPADFGFGFQQYLDESTMLDDPETIPVLDKQRQILSYLLNKLYESTPHSIVAVEREELESNAAEKGSNEFQISDAVSARVPGAIRTMGFSVSFTGYTDSMRSFLNQLAKFDLPIVVRSIEVERPSGQATTAAPTNNNDFDAIFGVFDDAASQEVPTEAQQPVISDNVSTFTVVVEFIEVILPSDSADENV